MTLYNTLAGVILTASVASASVAREAPESVQRAQFAGRSGMVVMARAGVPASDAAAVLVDTTQGQRVYDASLQQEGIEARHLADIATRSLGLTPLNADYTPEFVKADPFHAAQANVQVSIAGMGTQAVADLGLPNLAQLQEDNIAAPLTAHAYPQSSLTLAATLATGANPAEHGIVGAAWQGQDGQRVNAYEGHFDGAQVASVADVVSQSYAGRSLTVSLSGDAQHAAVHTPNQLLLSGHKGWKHNYALARSDDGFAPINGARCGAQLNMETGNTNNALKFRKESGLSAQVQGDNVQVQWGSGEASFDLSVAENRALFDELEASHSLTDKLSETPELAAMMRDDAKDHFALTFTALEPIAQRFGRDSTEFAGAARLVDDAATSFVERMQTLYGGRATAQVSLLGSQAAAAHSEVLAKVEENESSEFFPMVYGEVAACERLHSQLQGLEHDVHCAPVAEKTAPAGRRLLQATPTTEPTDTQIQKYQIVLWLSILLTLAVLGGAVSICAMDNRKDTLLYGPINPNWEDRKRR